MLSNLFKLDTNLASRRIIFNNNMKHVFDFLPDILKYCTFIRLIHVYYDNCPIPKLRAEMVEML